MVSPNHLLISLTALCCNMFGGIPAVIHGPGQPEMAHQTDEYCFKENIEKAVEIYKNIVLKRDV